MTLKRLLKRFYFVGELTKHCLQEADFLVFVLKHLDEITELSLRATDVVLDGFIRTTLDV